MSENTPPRERLSSCPPETSGFRTPEALVWGVFLGAAGVALAALVLSGAEIWTLDYWGSEDRSAVLRNLGLLVIAAPALYLAWKRTTTASRQADIANENKEISNRQQRVAERGLNIDRYQKGAQMLESQELSVRIAGIYGLRELAMSDPEESYILVQSLLFAFIREKSKERKLVSPEADANKKDTKSLTYEDLGPDICEALTATIELRFSISTATDLEEAAAWCPNLADANLSGANILCANLFGAGLVGANLSGAELWHANLSDACLDHADLTGTELVFANLRGANLREAKLSDTILTHANLADTIIDDADLSGARFLGSKLADADLSGCDLSGAILWSANLSNADLADIALDEDTDLTGIWAWADRPPQNMPPEIEAAIELRDPAGCEEGD
ncbi:pentapeptide repeat-containing protein [Stappia stellulata]|uniref:pentapeptide repeat-containing protein n=1 Tax=Stappia stellulata TaxID=71235 RepID=UPI001CD1D786|nr:pentapeptide repeat-containing protein [Stappia stellulata]MCA1242269.1 pentapeptide repeat-containing protein [Stappia stellulata]